MKKNLPVYLYGAIIIFVGVFLLFSKHYTFQKIKFTSGIALIIGAVLGFLTNFSRQKKQVAFLYHKMHALAMLVYGASILLFCDKLETLIYFTSFLLFFYAFSEIIFCSWLFNLRRKVIYKIVFIRSLLGLIAGIGVVVIMNYTSLDNSIDLEGFGLLFFIIGINILLYVPIMKTEELKKAFE
jgi:uncharacterized membrane protein HdeD (DUF308 family)